MSVIIGSGVKGHCYAGYVSTLNGLQYLFLLGKYHSYKEINDISRRSCRSHHSCFIPARPRWAMVPLTLRPFETLSLSSEGGGHVWCVRLLVPVPGELDSVCKAFQPLLFSLDPSDQAKPSSLASCLFFLGHINLNLASENSSHVYCKLLLFMFSEGFKKKKGFPLKKTESHFPFFWFHLLLS